MKLPKRIQRKRTKGWKQPENTCYCGRGSKWGNMFAVELWGLERSLRMYKNTLDTCVETGALDLTELLKYDYLSCWCPLDQKCHVDIIINKLKEYRYFKCNKCGAEYIIKGDYVGCCAMPATYRTSGICGGELIEIQKNKAMKLICNKAGKTDHCHVCPHGIPHEPKKWCFVLCPILGDKAHCITVEQLTNK